MTPLETDEITQNDKAVETREPFGSESSFLMISSANVVLVTWKGAADGDGTVLRFLEAAGGSAKVDVHIPFVKVQNAWLCDAVERNKQPLSMLSDGFQFSVRPFQIVTVRIRGNRSTGY
jgi:alpha-mannosidase